MKKGNVGQSTAPLALGKPKSGDPCGIKDETTVFLELCGRFCFHLLAYETQPERQVHKGIQCPNQFAVGWGMNLEIIHKHPDESHRESISSNSSKPQPKPRVVMSCVQPRVPPILLYHALESWFSFSKERSIPNPYRQDSAGELLEPMGSPRYHKRCPVQGCIQPR